MKPPKTEPESQSRVSFDGGLAGCCLLHAGVLGWAAYALPLRGGAIALALAVLAGGHLLLCIWAMRDFKGRRAWLFRNLARASLLLFIVVLALSLQSGLYIAQLYGGLGQGILAATIAAICVLALWTVPFGLWGIARCKDQRGSKGLASLGLVLLLFGGLAAMSSARHPARAKALPAPSAQALERALLPYLREFPPGAGDRRLRDPGPWSCAALDSGRGTVVVAFGESQGSPKAWCVEISSLDELGSSLQAAEVESLFRVEWVTRQSVLNFRQAEKIPALSLRPALDGVCMQGRCLSAWQLVALQAYVSLAPLSSIPDLRFGVSPKALQHWLGAQPRSKSLRLTSESYVVSPQGQVRALLRERRREARASASQLRAAKAAAQEYILRAQEPSGRFEYLQHAFLLDPVKSPVVLPRQGGTLFALCRWGEHSDRSQEAVRRASSFLLAHERRVGDWSVLVANAPWRLGPSARADLGSTALPLLALLQCRERVGAMHDESLGRMLQALLRFQRADGSFAPLIELRPDAVGTLRQEQLYASGQALFALLMAVDVLAQTKIHSWPTEQRLRKAARSAMRHYAQNYWGHFLSNFFFVEENWHCLAAEQSVRTLNYRPYEDFCLDYLNFKSRFTLDERSSVAKEFSGGYGFGNIVVPQTTPSAGQAEALAAGIEILEARFEDASLEKKELRLILDFLWRQQLDAYSCRGCADPPRLQGGFAESMNSPLVRIDYVQHAFAALAAGVKRLGLEEK